ncbi:DNA polymerase III subunit beta [Ancylobacter sp. SL191]|uniref:DNA polymerase III subunit beta n=1 Tax=Ancylobacter sp. SL191 TaxID=2995166 RepID=UPI0022718B9F|nr:DNA polymerase III subunit beta [Ancylobacter sp. SL191]WAC26387.1 DNA polymerase III subunit beta [Ancylobacter sp. SL191]
MKLTIERAPFLAALGRADRVVERRNTIPILANLRLKAEGSRLIITATDLDIEITQSLWEEAVQVATPGEITAPAHTLHDIVKKLPEGAQIQLEVTGDRSTLTVRAGRSRFSLQTLPVTDFPDLTAAPEGVKLALPGKAFAEALGRVEFAISTEETRYYLNGIFIHRAALPEGDPRLTLVATDGHRLSLVRLPGEGAPIPEDMPGVILPRKAVGEVKRLAEEAGANPLHIEVSTTKLAAEHGGVRVVTKLIDGTFPDYGRVIPFGNARLATVARAELAAAADRVGTLSSDRGKAVKFIFATGGLVLEATNPESGSARDEIDCAFTDDEISIGFNGRYVGDVLKADDAPQVEIALNDPGSPTIFRRPGSTDALCVLMPMRV